MNRKLLITGAYGQLGREMRNALSELEGRCDALYTDVDTLDITDAKAVDSLIASNNVGMIVNCAAYTAVDRAEDEPELCRKINVDAVANLAMAARAHGAKVVHISTDYVFDGTGCRPYTETDATCPQSVYGSTKLEGERQLTRILPQDSVIVRTSWLYSPYGKNFVKTMIALGQSRPALSVVCDQMGTPTAAADLAAAIVTLLKAGEWKAGIYHFSNEGAISWYDFTMAIHRLAGITGCDVSPIRTDQYPTRARRPSYSVLDKSKIKSELGLRIPYWEESLARCISILKQQEN